MTAIVAPQLRLAAKPSVMPVAVGSTATLPRQPMDLAVPPILRIPAIAPLLVPIFRPAPSINVAHCKKIVMCLSMKAASRDNVLSLLLSVFKMNADFSSPLRKVSTPNSPMCVAMVRLRNNVLHWPHHYLRSRYLGRPLSNNTSSRQLADSSSGVEVARG